MMKFTAQQLKKFRDHNLINEIAVRNVYLKLQYIKKIKQNPTRERTRIKQEIVDEYNKGRNGECITLGLLHSILFSKPTPKKTPLIKEII